MTIRPRYTKFFAFLIAILLAATACISCKKIQLTPRISSAHNGLADLRDIDLARHGPVILNGEWDFAWMADDAMVPDPARTGWKSMRVPSYWNGLTGSGSGSAWYRLCVRVSEADRTRDLALYIRGANTAHTCYVNGRKLMHSGVAGATAARTRPLLKPVMQRLPSAGPNGELVINVRVSNYHHRGGGMNKSPVIGTFDDIESTLWRDNLFDTMALGFILLMLIFHLIQWFTRKEETTNLYFALMCLAIFIHTAAREDYIERTFPLLDVYSIRFTLEYVALPFSWLFATVYVSRLFPRDVPSAVVRAIIAAAIVTIVITLASPAWLFSRIIILFVIQLGAVALILIPCVFLATLRRREDSPLLFASLLVLLVTVVNDVLNNFSVIETGFVSQFGLCFLMVIQSVVISLRASRSLRTVEHLSAHLQEEVASTTEALKRQTDEAISSRKETESMFHRLDEVYSQMKHELTLAKNIQRNILPRNIDEIAECRIEIVYRPLMDIGGDMYDIHRGPGGCVRVFLADALGHGVSAALVTMYIKSEYEKLKGRDLGPYEVLSALNDVFYNHYSAFRISLTGIVLDIDVRGGEIRYASAGHPPQYAIGKRGTAAITHTCRGIGISESLGGGPASLPCAPGDSIVLLTDGMYEQFNEAGEEYGWDRFSELMDRAGRRTAADIMRAITDSLAGFSRGREQNDDVTIAVIELLQGGGG